MNPLDSSISSVVDQLAKTFSDDTDALILRVWNEAVQACANKAASNFPAHAHFAQGVYNCVMTLKREPEPCPPNTEPAKL